jgi:hypothetical protein
MALDLVDLTPEAVIIIGELRQNNRVLDPYLVVRTATDEICLGIWDNDTILYQAIRA